MASILEHLNEPQRTAVTWGDGPLLIIAGAGSGKTRVLTHRIAHLLAEGRAESGEITAVTFTNKAADEMKTRVRELAGDTARHVFVGTFHRWALEILRRYPEEAGLPRRFSIIDSDEQRTAMTRCIKAEELDTKEYPARMVLSIISRRVNEGDSRSDFEKDTRFPNHTVIARLWKRYEKAKKDSGSVDFDDMLIRARDLLRSHSGIRRTVQRRARYLLVDEFQDTNVLQLELLKLAVGDSLNISAVGDEDQSIYGWRGASMDNILKFEEHFAGAEIVKLEQNYRSTKAILETAATLIDNNQMRRGKRLFTEGAEGEDVRVHIANDEREEAAWVVDQFEGLRSRYELGDMAVLVRTNAQTRPFEEELTRRRINYRVVGGLRFWQRAEVKDALAYIRLMLRDDDALAFERIVNVPTRGIGKVTLDALRHHAAEKKVSLPVAARSLPGSLNKRARISLERFFSLIDEARSMRDQLSAGDFVGWLLETSGLLMMYEGEADEKVAKRENLQQLAGAVAEAENQGQSLEDLIDSVALMSDTDVASSADAVSLMTLHSAKGLEFSVVMLAGLEDGLLPHANARETEAGLEEERRLAYVGMTRARDILGLSAARTRFLFGDRNFTTLSRFLEEIPHSPTAGPAAQTDVYRSPSRPADSLQQPVPARRSPSRRKKAPNAVLDESGTGWRPGERVRHRRFGTGVVLACQGRGPQLKLVVYFDRAGRKTLVPTIARLEKT